MQWDTMTHASWSRGAQASGRALGTLFAMEVAPAWCGLPSGVVMSIVSSFTSRVAALVAACLLVCVALPAAHAEPPSGVININQASAEQLMLLPRVGEEKAKRIIEYRQKSPFKTALELGRVKGIGLKTLRLLKPFIRVDGPTTLAAEIKPEDAETAAEREPAPKVDAPPGAKPPGK